MEFVQIEKTVWWTPKNDML